MFEFCIENVILDVVKTTVIRVFIHIPKTLILNGHVDVVIQDDGRGFPAAGRNGDELPMSSAPWSIRERVESLGGSLSLHSRAGSGSEIRITLPRPAA